MHRCTCTASTQAMILLLTHMKSPHVLLLIAKEARDEPDIDFIKHRAGRAEKHVLHRQRAWMPGLARERDPGGGGWARGGTARVAHGPGGEGAWVGVARRRREERVIVAARGGGVSKNTTVRGGQ
jgi:hypothetical protein